MNAFPPKRIAVAADPTAPSRAAVEDAAWLARRWGARLELLHVDHVVAQVEPAPAPLAGGYWWPYADFREWRKDRVLGWLKGFPSKRLRVHSVPGWPPAMLRELARRGSADLLVMGTHGYAGLDRALFGSVAEAVVRISRIPVLVAHERRTPWRPRRVLAAWNGRPYADEALKTAGRWAASLGASLEVLHVAPPWARERTAAGRAAARIGKLLRGLPRPRVTVRLGDARELIVGAARNADLLVLAAHRRPFTSDMVLGSTVERSLRHCPTPILAVPSDEPRGGRLRLPPSAWLGDEPYLF